MSKVKIPRDVAEAIEQVRGHYKTGCEYDLDFLEREDYGAMSAITRFVNESRENKALYFKAIVNGWEVEETPEEQVLALYKKYPTGTNSDFHFGYREGIRHCLDCLGITVEGVNDHE